MAQDLVHDVEADTFFRRERARLRDCEHLGGVDELIAQLHDLTEPRSARVHDERRERFERGPGGFEHGRVAAHHHGEGAALGADRSPRQRPVEIRRTGRRDPIVLFALDRGIDRGGVDDDLAGTEHGQRPVDDLDDVGRVGDAQDRDLARGDHRTRVAGLVCTRGDGGVDRWATARRHRDVVTRGEEVPGHGQAHRTEPDESDLHELLGSFAAARPSAHLHASARVRTGNASATTLRAMAEPLLFVTQVAPYPDGPAGVHGVLDQAAVGVAQVAEMHGLRARRVDDVRDVSVDAIRDARALALFTIGETPWSKKQQRAILERVRAGRLAICAIHSATDSCYGWDEYGELVGARFDGHPWTQTFVADVLDPSHPACAHLGADWRWHDEVYQFRDLRPDAQVLLRVRDGELDLGAAGARGAGVRIPAGVVLRRGPGPGVLHQPRALPGRVGVAGVSPPPLGWARVGAGRFGVSRTRNFSNWAYWRLRHEEIAAAGPPSPGDDDEWRRRTRARSSSRCSARTPNRCRSTSR